MLFSFLRLQSSLLALQLNSITLMLPYNHFSSLRLDSFPGLTEKRPNYSLTLTLVLIFSLFLLLRDHSFTLLCSTAGKHLFKGVNSGHTDNMATFVPLAFKPTSTVGHEHALTHTNTLVSYLSEDISFDIMLSLAAYPNPNHQK